MKRYMLFSGNQYYPAGGMDDFRGSFDTIDEAKSYIKYDLVNDWYQLYDIIECKLVDITN
jgi:hypothetical protein